MKKEKENEKKSNAGRKRIYTAEERKNHRTKYMLNKEWYCDICKTGLNYTMSGKWCHIKTKKHQKNMRLSAGIDEKDINLIMNTTGASINEAQRVLIKNDYDIINTMTEINDSKIIIKKDTRKIKKKEI